MGKIEQSKTDLGLAGFVIFWGILMLVVSFLSSGTILGSWLIFQLPSAIFITPILTLVALFVLHLSPWMLVLVGIGVAASD